MGKLFDKLHQDIRFLEGMHACINCGTCTAICPAAEFYKYDPRQIVDTLQRKEEKTLEDLLKSETIWYCGECMSCVTRCPKNNAPGLIIIALRSLSQEMGFFTASEKGRQQLVLKRSIGEWILKYGYCVYPRELSFENHPEAGPIWQWTTEHLEDIHERLGSNLDKTGPGVLRKIPEEALEELRRIFEETGGLEFYEKIEGYSQEKANEMGLSEEDYFQEIYTCNRGEHQRNE